MNSKNSITNTYFVIMAGGIGSRFWPASREAMPKQFLDVLGTGRSLIQMTYDRISPLVPANQIIVMTHERYRSLVRQHLPAVPSENILVEPSRQNTAPCVAYVSFHIAARNPNANMVILPADHLITREQIFQNTLIQSVEYVTDHTDILTLGMAPHRPDTGYGYIQLGQATGEKNIRHVDAFKEKPNLSVAKTYLEDQNHVWNAGIFISSVATMITAFEQHATEIYNILNAPKAYGSKAETTFIQDNYPKTPSISIDYAIMEKANNIVCFVVDIGWSDIGTWRSLHELKRGTSDHIVTNNPKDDYYITQSDSLMIHSLPGKKMLIKGLKNMIVIDQEDILMIWPLEAEQEIKTMREELSSKWNVE
ncbi:mannose-1-phosphate guanylyltransferase [Membranicola marinus]|uniref:Mannose-1-phosphate guanylyltransferase n=1 Tax=Membranihabitans marinus TaxID=1227546 RepID=A0A953LCY1_9BACT|nr:mannose-1-phosphate guanylyltransferase [Membranihabitans marinus]MBY5959981.1 mannose-1-phosphate guanylyltransferase [Membranihabitans marinus]